MENGAIEPISETAPLAANAKERDDNLVDLWLHGRSPHTQRAYRRDVARLRAYVRKPLAEITLADLQAFADSLAGAQSSMNRTLNGCRSLLTFAKRTGAVPFNVGAALLVPKSRDTLADRILSEREVNKMRRAAATPREVALIELFYGSAFRLAEMRGLRWSDAAEASDGGAYLTVFGKGNKTRTVRIVPKVWRLVEALRGDAPIDAPVFVGRSGALDPSSIYRVVRAIARRAGIDKRVGPHHLRHCHASHALERGAPLALVRDTLGHSSIAVTDIYTHVRPGESSGKYLR